jgi:hypothetical protein
MAHLTISIIGNAIERRTEAEIVWQTSGAEGLLAVVYDTDEGWKTQVENPTLATECGPEFTVAVEAARKQLSEYVNRLGKGSPSDLTLAGLSLWLLEKADGTAMSR